MSKVWIALIILVIIGFFSLTFATFMAIFLNGVSPPGNIAVIPVSGIIMGEKSGPFSSGIVSSKTVVKLIKKADKKSEVKALIIEINSPGGSAVASAEIANAITKVKKPVVAVIREAGASGGYWIASATDKIYANELSITGSIGVISSYLEFADFIDRYNITYRRLVAGENKDIGNPFAKLTQKKEELLQIKLDKIHAIFIKTVAKNRNLSEEKVKEIADGFFMLGIEALEIGLIDEIGDRDSAIKYLEEKLNITAKTAEYKKDKTLGEILMGASSGFSYSIGQGIGDSIKSTFTENSLVPFT